MLPESNSTTKKYNTSAAMAKRKREMAISLIQATEQLLHTEGLMGVTIRKIASAVGCNSATLYSYFHDLDHLLLFASIHYLRDYLLRLSQHITADMDGLARYRMVYECFNYHAFRSPEIFYHMFFGKYSQYMSEVLHVYYGQLFPEELQGLPEDVRAMVSRGNMIERDQAMMARIVAEGQIAPEHADEVIEIVLALSERFTHQACLLGEDFDVEAKNVEFLQLFDYVMDRCSIGRRGPLYKQ